MTVTPLSDAQIIPFYLTSGAKMALIRGRIASVGQPATVILQRHAHPPAIAKMQAEALALTVRLASTLNLTGSSRRRQRAMRWLEPCLLI